MTFIATVVAKNGVAIIADSLVTSTQPVIEYNEFIKFFEKKSAEVKDETLVLDPKEIISLFEAKPHHTKNYEEKLFQYDKYTAITTAGAATINDKRIVDLIEEIKLKNKKTKGYSQKKFENKIKDFSDYLTEEVKTHLTHKTTIRPTTFIFTHFSNKTNKTIIYKVEVLSSSQKHINDKDYKFVTYSATNEYEKVVCDGQNRISEKILFGDVLTVFGLIPRIVFKVAKDFGIDEKNISESYINNLRKDKDIVPPTLFSDMKIFKLGELSLQQAVDLANLLMKLEIDFQNYTEDIPTVGGLIKLAVIDKNGFRFIAGHEITKPINL
ncbi:MAG TPA: hypothetical protein PLG05_09750 [Bacteroidales bacterium]|nr:hypothetical protein [Bacteroidales bacterium]HOR61042.1 hypothetical protein [Bacteroidales bacterium]HPL05446.1 hypothetical protein [Bacteroidales bacterium]